MDFGFVSHHLISAVYQCLQYSVIFCCIAAGRKETDRRSYNRFADLLCLSCWNTNGNRNLYPRFFLPDYCLYCLLSEFSASPLHLPRSHRPL